MTHQYTTVKIAVERADGGVSILSFMTVGRGNALPKGAEWLDQSAGSWSRVPTDASVADEVVRAVPDFVAWHRILDDEVPQDRTFRDALVVKDGSLTHSIDKARDLTRNMLRHRRAAAMPELDGQWMRATGQGKKAEANKIEAERQKWRDAPANPLIDAAATVETLRTVLG